MHLNRDEVVVVPNFRNCFRAGMSGFGCLTSCSVGSYGFYSILRRSRPRGLPVVGHVCGVHMCLQQAINNVCNVRKDVELQNSVRKRLSPTPMMHFPTL